jgi:uncharacterized protein (UPF0303 family)
MSAAAAKDRALLKTLLDQERRLQFDSFDNETAIALGLALTERGHDEGLPIAVDVTRNQQQIFRAALGGTSIDNDFWIKGKNAVVYRFGHSSLYVGVSARLSGKTLEEKYLVDSREFRAHGGAFPVFVKSVGLVGTITVSGLAQEDDHRLVVEAIAAHLGRGSSGAPRRAKRR